LTLGVSTDNEVGGSDGDYLPRMHALGNDEAQFHREFDLSDWRPTPAIRPGNCGSHSAGGDWGTRWFARPPGPGRGGGTGSESGVDARSSRPTPYNGRQSIQSEGIVVVKIARMQHIYGRRCMIFARPQLLLAFAVPLLLAAGCIERPTTIDPVPTFPHAGVVLKVAVSDPSDRELVRQLGRSWTIRSGGRVEVLDTPWDGSADVGLVVPAEMPRWAAARKLAEVPTRITRPVNHPYRWDDVLRDYRERLLDWGGTTYALPVTGEGMVLAYRKDAFDGKDGRPSTLPVTWDGLLETGRTAHRQFGKCLPPVPAGRDRLAAEIFAAAACYDPPAVGRLTRGEPGG